MDQDIIRDARARISNLFGETFASKASDAFCLAFGRPTAGMAEGFAEAGVPPQPMVIELTPQPEVTAAINNAVEGVRKTRAWASVRNALKRIEIPAVTRGVVT